MRTAVRFTAIFLIPLLSAGIAAAQNSVAPAENGDGEDGRYEQPIEAANDSEIETGDDAGLDGPVFRLSTIVILPIVAIAGDPSIPIGPGESDIPDPYIGTATAEGELSRPIEWTFGIVRDVIITSGGEVSHLIVDINGFRETEMGTFLARSENITVTERGVGIEVPQSELTRIEDASFADEVLGEGFFRSTRVVDYIVTDPDGERLGEVADIVADFETGDILYIAIERGDGLGLGAEDRLYAVPFESVVIEKNEEQIVADVSETVLEERREFDEEHWPELAE